jgi:hypothetical protein
MPNWISRAVSGARRMFAAGSQLPPVPVPKVKPKQSTVPSFFTSAQPNPDSVLPRTDRNLISTNLETYRAGGDTRVVMRDFVASNPDLGAAVFAYLRTAITDDYTAVARNMDGTFNRDATLLVQQILTRFDVVQNYDDGFSGVSSIQSTSEALVKQLMTYGAMALELVLDKGRLPRTLQPVSVTQIQFKPDTKGGGLRPIQKLGAAEIDLDIPTFMYVSLDQDLLDAYASSPLEPALQPVLFSTEFMNDLRRVIKRVIHPRLLAKIAEEQFRKHVPPDVIAKGADGVRGYMDAVIADIESQVNSLNPEDALVYFDTVDFNILDRGNTSLDAEYTALGGMIDAKMATGAKALPSILGHGSGSQNMASSETLLFMKNANGVRKKLNEIYSRALTLAVRLFGQDVYVEFTYAAIDLRPDSETEAFKSMKQSRILELLSYGFKEDDEASIELTGRVTPAGFKPLSGTGFYQKPAANPATNGNPNSGTSTAAGGGNNAGQQARDSNAPKAPKGPVKK